jgi:hypothetical protein
VNDKKLGAAKYKAEWYQENRERIVKQHAAYRRENPQKAQKVPSCEHASERRRCRICKPMGWASRLLRDSKYRAKVKGYEPAKATAEEVVEMMMSGLCFLCPRPLNWDKVSGQNAPSLHHDHVTGKVYGFAHLLCNLGEGVGRGKRGPGKHTIRDLQDTIIELKDTVKWQQALIEELRQAPQLF